MKLRPHTSQNLVRHGDSQTVLQCAFLLLASLFWGWAVIKDTPIMTADDYGAWVTQWPAEYWAASLLLASCTYLLGIIINGNWRWSPLLRMAGAAWHAMTLGAFAVSAGQAATGDFIVLCSTVFAIVHIWFVFLNVMDMRRGLRRVG